MPAMPYADEVNLNLPLHPLLQLDATAPDFPFCSFISQRSGEGRRICGVIPGPVPAGRLRSQDALIG